MNRKKSASFFRAFVLDRRRKNFYLKIRSFQIFGENLVPFDMTYLQKSQKIASQNLLKTLPFRGMKI